MSLVLNSKNYGTLYLWLKKIVLIPIFEAIFKIINALLPFPKLWLISTYIEGRNSQNMDGSVLMQNEGGSRSKVVVDVLAVAAVGALSLSFQLDGDKHSNRNQSIPNHKLTDFSRLQF